MGEEILRTPITYKCDVRKLKSYLPADPYKRRQDDLLDFYCEIGQRVIRVKDVKRIL